MEWLEQDMLIGRDGVERYVTIEGIDEVSFASWVDAPASSFELDGLGHLFGYLGSDLPDDDVGRA